VHGEKSATVAALLSFIFPGLGQAYLGDRRMAVVFASPVLVGLLVLVVAVISQGGIARAGARFFDPAVAFPAAIAVILFGLWWITGIIHAWRSAGSGSTAPLVVALALVFAVGAADVFAAVQLYRVGNAGGTITDPDRDLTDEANRPTARPTVTPTTPGATVDPAASPTQPPPDVVIPDDDPTDEPEPSIEPGPTPSFDIGTIDASNDGYLNVMLAGIDWIEGRVGARTDTILVVSVHNSTGEVFMFSVPRDLQGFPIYNGGTFSGKINTFAGVTKNYPDQFGEGGMPVLANQVGFMLGIPIDYYASVNMSGFLDVVRIVGSVTVCNPRDINDDHLRFYLPAGRHRLGPDDALRFVRSRKGQSGGDFARARRQQEVLSALKREMLKPENLPRIPDIAEALAQVIGTNYPPGQIDQLLALAERVEDEPSASWILKDPQFADFMTRQETGGRQKLVPRMDRIAELSRQVFGEASLYWNGQAPVGTPLSPPDTTPSADPSGSDNPC
jgi:LCP family protein required for cell wall assembly